ncbi:hypothetical protein BHE74_00011443, partial [Ensete ventricosum]
ACIWIRRGGGRRGFRPPNNDALFSLSSCARKRVELGESESVGKGNEKMSGACRANGVAAPIPTGSRKLVQSLREIVHCPEPEIYAMLRECNMDPNEAAHRLLGQGAPLRCPFSRFFPSGLSLVLLFAHEIFPFPFLFYTFHEVKSKRDKKREVSLEQLMAVQVVGLGLALTVVPVGLLPNLVLLLNHSGQWFELNEVDRLVSPLGSGHDRAPPRRAPSVPLYYSPNVEPAVGDECMEDDVGVTDAEGGVGEDRERDVVVGVALHDGEGLEEDDLDVDDENHALPLGHAGLDEPTLIQSQLSTIKLTVK